ncbi:MAG TPA: hypothetical protein VNF29_15650 [Candidatus Binataceae bacterium]|nr:hypothetical protein [Candidatus Binataceae bacterium]
MLGPARRAEIKLPGWMRPWTLAAILLAGALFPARAAAAAPPVFKLLGFSSADFEILDPANSSVIGHAHYVVAKDGDGITLHGIYRYTSGQYDIEHDRFVRRNGALPVLVSADHYFYRADGAPEIESNFDLKSGVATCTDYRLHPAVRSTVRLTPPQGTWAGASVMIPIQEFLRHGGRGTLLTHVFNCAPIPKIFAVRVSVDSAPTSAPIALSGTMEVDVHPEFGWLNLFVAPFAPHLKAWFDPHRDWDLVGATLARFYNGPDIMLARVPESARWIGRTAAAPFK